MSKPAIEGDRPSLHGQMLGKALRAAFDAWLNHADPERRLDVYQAAREYAKNEIANADLSTEVAPAQRESP